MTIYDPTTDELLSHRASRRILTEKAWSPRKTFLFVVISSAALWAGTIALAIRFA